MSNMTAETIQAIHDSIQHWCRMRSDPLGCGEEPHSDDCALCQSFYHCKYCPVAERVGEDGCVGTPYTKARDAWYDYLASLTEENLRKWRNAANAEIAFLNSLLTQNGAA